MNNSNVGVIVLHYRGKKAEGMVSVAALQVPAKARKEYEKGSELLEKGNLPEAEKSLRKAIDMYPKFAEAWLRLGDLEIRRKNLEGASADYQEAINADPNFTLPYIRLTAVLARTQDWEQTRKLSERLISMDPVNFPQAYYYNAIANMNQNHMPQAETSALKAESLDKQHGEPRIELVLATIYVAQGSYSSAADHYRAYLKLVPDGPLNERVKTDLAKIEEMAKSQPSAAPPVNK
jgi:tetratricopeptide (TPR) repeat protein